MQARNDNISRRSIVLALAGSSTLATTGCFGSFGLSKMVYDWNDSFGSKWVKWLVFLGLTILPIYAITLFVDALVLNSIEFWFGSHPVSGKTDLPGGRHVASKPTKDPNVIRHELYEGDRRLAVLYLRREGEDGLSLLDENGKTITRVSLEGSALKLEQDDGKVIARLDREQCKRAADATRQGIAPREAVFDELLNSGQLASVNTASSRASARLNM